MEFDMMTAGTLVLPERVIMTTGDGCPTNGNHSNNEMWR